MGETNPCRMSHHEGPDDIAGLSSNDGTYVDYTVYANFPMSWPIAHDFVVVDQPSNATTNRPEMEISANVINRRT
jgi:hypothetical protein